MSRARGLFSGFMSARRAAAWRTPPRLAPLARWLRLLALLLLPALQACGGAPAPPGAARNPPAPATDAPTPLSPRAATPESGAPDAGGAAARSSRGFRSAERLHEHYLKHGAEFGRLSEAEYLATAQALRDAPVGGPILELRRPDGVVSRYDRRSGTFLAFDADGTIRTCFRPNDGEAYFRRQANRRPHR